ncbi:MAG: GTP 3',8-cyclase MoaA, partial [Gemmatimonadota bacterium]|nr:GTP 3',8-cyclase MoaA [Gemmatimonadota bacterium]
TDGKLYTCLFASEGTDLRDVLRQGASNADLCDQIIQIWRHRADRYSEIRSEHTPATRKIEMYQIGG